MERSHGKLLTALRGTTAISGMILFVIVGATTFSQILSFSGASNGIVLLIVGHGLTKNVIIADMMPILIFLGIFVDQVSMMLITLPIFMPRSAEIRHRFGLVRCDVPYLYATWANVAAARVAADDNEGCGTARDQDEYIFRSVVPYIMLSLVLLALVFFLPAVAVWLPNLFL